MRILVVEDDPKVGGFLEQGLREEEYEVARGHDGEEALSLALCSDYDLILLDYMLPKRTGPQVVKALRDAPGEAPRADFGSPSPFRRSAAHQLLNGP